MGSRPETGELSIAAFVLAESLESKQYFIMLWIDEVWVMVKGPGVVGEHYFKKQAQAIAAAKQWARPGQRWCVRKIRTVAQGEQG